MNKKTIRFRVAYFASDVAPYTITADTEDQERCCQDDPRFLFWVTDWQTAEVCE
jgi:hypothetical protein